MLIYDKLACELEFYCKCVHQTSNAHDLAGLVCVCVCVCVVYVHVGVVVISFQSCLHKGVLCMPAYMPLISSLLYFITLYLTCDIGRGEGVV